MTAIRKVNSNDVSELKKLWAAVFYDDDLFLSAFFSTLSTVTEAFAAEDDGQIVGSAYILDILTYRNGDTSLPCPYIYAVCVHPEYRGQGIGKALTIACRNYCSEKYGVSCLAPADEGLFDYYRRVGYAAALYADECAIEREGAIKAELTPISPEKYGELREQLLADKPHMEYNVPALYFLKELCELTGGGIYMLRSDDAYAIAACENTETLFVKELLCSNDNARGFAAALLWHEDCDSLTYRTPTKAPNSESTKAFGMLSKSLFDGPIYMGPAFD